MWDRVIICTASSESYWLSQKRYSDASVQVTPGNLGVSKVSCVYSRTTPAGTREDLATFTLTMAIRSGVGVATYLTDAQKTAAETPLKAFIDSLALVSSNQWQHERFIWHDWTEGDPPNKDGSAGMGPADRITTYLKVGAVASTRCPDQLAVSVTFKTASRQHWGRFYIGGLNRAVYETTYGRITNADCDSFASYTRTLSNALNALPAVTELVVFSPQHYGVLSIDEIQVDNVPDVIRRRRPKMASYRKTYTS